MDQVNRLTRAALTALITIPLTAPMAAAGVRSDAEIIHRSIVERVGEVVDTVLPLDPDPDPGPTPIPPRTTNRQDTRGCGDFRWVRDTRTRPGYDTTIATRIRPCSEGPRVTQVRWRTRNYTGCDPDTRVYVRFRIRDTNGVRLRVIDNQWSRYCIDGASQTIRWDVDPAVRFDGDGTLSWRVKRNGEWTPLLWVSEVA